MPDQPDPPALDPFDPWRPGRSVYVPPVDSPPTYAAGPRVPDRPGPHGYTGIAWLVICIGVAASILLNTLDLKASQTSGQGEDGLSIILLELQGKYAVGAANSTAIPSNPSLLYNQLEQLNIGPISQRQRFVILAAELGGAPEASRLLNELDDLIESKGVQLTETQAGIQEILHALYDPAAESSTSTPPTTQPAVEALTSDQRDRLVQELGWFGRLALAPPITPDQQARDAVIGPAITLFHWAIALFVLGIAAAFIGFVGLIVLLVLTFTGRLRGGLMPSPVHHGIYAETFAIWMPAFLVLQLGAGLLGTVLSDLALMLAFIAFLLSLFVLAWPVFRGIPWRQVRMDIGWTAGRRPLLEPLLGPTGYIVGLPIVAIGISITLVLVLIQQALTPEGDPLDPATGPAHPIIEHLANAGWALKIQLLMLGAVAAPIVEETMFRGVLYRHLRDGFGRMGAFGSIACSTLLNSFIFAAIHPQGWAAIPALMSLAIAFSLMREWRGTLIPSMIMHGIQNFLTFTLLMAALSL